MGGDSCAGRVAVVHDLHAGGAHRRLAAQLAEVRRLGWETVELTLATADPVTPDALVLPLRRRADAAPAPLRPLLRYTDLAALLRAYRRLWRLAGRAGPDVVWANPCQFLQAPALLRSAPAPVVYYCDEPRRVDVEGFTRSTTRRRTRALYAPMRRVERRHDRRGTRAADFLATNSRYTAHRIAAAYGRTATVVPCGVDPFFAPAPDPEPPRHLLSVGTLIPSKGHDLAIASAAAAGLGLPLVVVGPRPAPVEQARLHRLASEYGVALDLRVGISDTELRELYRTAFATLYLAIREPLGLASLEAQACGCPVVVSAEGGLPETVTPGVSGWAVPRHAEAAAARLRQLTDPSLRRRLAAGAADRGAAASWIASARGLADLLAAAGRRADARRLPTPDPRPVGTAAGTDTTGAA